MAKSKKIYAVAAGRRPGIYDTWFGPEGAQVQVAGYKGARYKGFASKGEALAWLGNAPVDEVAVGPAADDVGRVIIHTDGGCLNNPGPGGYGAVISIDGHRKEIYEGFVHTTNNRMELKACIEALKSVDPALPVVLYSDSSYVVNGVSKGWARKWRKNGWIKSNGQPAENYDLWQEMLAVLNGRQVEMRWVKGHAGIPENERCDELAGNAARRRDRRIDEAFENQATTIQARLDITR